MRYYIIVILFILVGCEKKIPTKQASNVVEESVNGAQLIPSINVDGKPPLWPLSVGELQSQSVFAEIDLSSVITDNLTNSLVPGVMLLRKKIGEIRADETSNTYLIEGGSEITFPDGLIVWNWELDCVLREYCRLHKRIDTEQASAMLTSSSYVYRYSAYTVLLNLHGKATILAGYYPAADPKDSEISDSIRKLLEFTETSQDDNK